MDELLEHDALYVLEFATAGEILDLMIDTLSSMDTDDAKDELLMLIGNKALPKINKMLLGKVKEEEYLSNRAATAYQTSLME